MLKPIKTQDECNIALERVYKLMQKKLTVLALFLASS